MEIMIIINWDIEECDGLCKKYKKKNVNEDIYKMAEN
jgi:hypothetical protein